MKIFICLIFLFVLVGCTSPDEKSNANASTLAAKTSLKGNVEKSKREAVITPYKINEQYIVIDTGVFDATLMSSTYAIVFRNNKLADTIDKSFGMHRVAEDRYLYLTLTADEPIRESRNKNGTIKRILVGTFGNYVVNTNGKKQSLEDLTNGFDDNFSSPFVINDKIYFWQINRKSSTIRKIFAAEYDPKTGVTKNSYLLKDKIGAEGAEYLRGPYLTKDTIYFDFSDEKKYKFSSKDFKRYN